MDDLISRQAAIDDLNLADDRGQIYSILDVIKVIKALPSAQPEDYAHGFADGYKQGQKDAQPERKTGEWIRNYSRPNVYADLCWHCSHCEYKTPDNWANKWNFCPNCGADMRGENNVDNN